MASYLRKYATGSGADIYINIPKAGSANHAVGADWTPAAGDVKVSIDGGAAANIGTLPTAVAMGNSAIWKFVFTNSELTGKKINVTVSDSATKAVDDTGFSIETFGNASAMIVFDLSTATQSVNVSQLSGDTTAADNAEAFFDGTGYAGTNNVIPTVTTLTGHTAQTGDAFARLGAPAGASVSADIAAIEAQTDDIGAAGAGLTAITTDLAAILVDTSTTLDDLVDDLESRLTAALAAKLSAHSLAVLELVVDAGSTTTAVVFKTVNGSAPSATNDFYNGQVIKFTSGALAGQATSISDYVGATVTATVVALTGAPAEDVTAVIE